eukprot:Skav235600  [mRNA]  locus=scaffold3336:43361:45020:- [translate_table: standard]
METEFSSYIKLIKPMRIFSTVQLGFQDSLWKSLMERQMRLLISKRPLGVNSLIDGGFMGKSSGNSRMP